MKNAAIPSRVNYFDHQFLRRQEFVDEQAYQLALGRRHNIGQHEWGIVVGLDIAIEEGALIVRPGMAIDGYGRELLLPARQEIVVGEFLRLGSERLDVWLYYEQGTGVGAPAGYVACGSDATDTSYRTKETPRIFLERAGVSRVNARRPKVVPKAVLDAPIQLDTPDEPLTVWPVYLGRITSVPQQTDPAKSFLIDASDRPYAGIIAEVVQHPASAARVEIGRVFKNDEERTIGENKILYRANEQRGFAIFVPSQVKELDPRFEIDTDDSNTLRGSTTLFGNLLLAQGAVQFSKATPTKDEAERKDPSIYRAKGDNDSDELRIDLGQLTNTNRVFVIGLTTDDGTFKPSLRLEYKKPADDQNPQPLLTIFGDLKLNGLIRSAGVIERTLAPEALDALLASFQAGIAAGSGK
jgi:hypothetical protein